MTTRSLGEFEQLVLLAVLHIEGEAYGVPIVRAIQDRLGRDVDRTAVYVTLRRLESRGLLRSWMSEPRAERGGKARRCVEVTADGARALLAARHTMDRMWSGLDPELAALLEGAG